MKQQTTLDAVWDFKQAVAEFWDACRKHHPMLWPVRWMEARLTAGSMLTAAPVDLAETNLIDGAAAGEPER